MVIFIRQYLVFLKLLKGVIFFSTIPFLQTANMDMNQLFYYMFKNEYIYIYITF